MVDYNELQTVLGVSPKLGESRWRELDREIIRLRAKAEVLKIREQELLDLKGPCSNKACPLHYAHSGPCDTKGGEGRRD